MNIIHLLSQNQLTGAEVYASTLAETQMRDGHNVFQVSNGFFYETKASKHPLNVETKSKLEFFKNVFWLREFIKNNNIHIVHSHSRASVKLAYWSTLGTHTAHISTVHGVQHSSFSKKLHNQYGEFILAVCENLKNHLIHDFSYNENRIKVLRNPINTDNFYFIEKNAKNVESLKIAIVGRTTGPKKTRTEQVINALKKTPHEITIIGGKISDLNLDENLKSRLKEERPQQLSSSIYSRYDLVIGSGRVCMESILTGVKTIAFGEACYEGLITSNNLQGALTSNFGDIHPNSKYPNLNTEQFLRDLNEETSNLKTLSDIAKQEFSLNIISKKIQRIYESGYFLKNYKLWIPILMYHKIPDTEIQSQHKIFVTKINFEKHLQFFKKRGFQTLTFSDLKLFRTGQKSFKDFPKKPLILTFDDGYKDNLINASPLLKKYNYKAQIFLLADKAIKENSWDLSSDEPSHEIISGNERQKWKESAFEIGSHGFSHQKITEFSPQEAYRELCESKKSLEAEFNQNTNVFAFTYGITNTASAEIAQDAGYDYALNTDTGGLLLEENPYQIFRVNIFPDESFWSLFKKTSKWYRKYYYLKRNK